MTDRRYPLGPLAHLMGIQLGRTGGDRPGETRGLTLLAARLGVSRSWALKYQREGLSEDQADRYAQRIGYHPGNVWPEWWDIDELTLQREARNPTDLDNDDTEGDRYGFAF